MVLDGFNLLWKRFDVSIVIQTIRNPDKAIRLVNLKRFSQTCCFTVPWINSSCKKPKFTQSFGKRGDWPNLSFLGVTLSYVEIIWGRKYLLDHNRIRKQVGLTFLLFCSNLRNCFFLYLVCFEAKFLDRSSVWLDMEGCIELERLSFSCVSARHGNVVWV